MDLNVIRKLVKIVELSTITELEIEEGQSKIKISKGSNSSILHSSSTHYPSIHSVGAQHPSPAEPSVVVPAVVDQSKQSDLDATSKLYEVKSPIVGTFYRAPSPDADEYCKVGDKVNVGSVICIVEAMKLMNEIESDVAGRIVKIMVENGRPIEYNQVLFLIDLD